MSFLEKNLHGITEIVESSLFADKTSQLPGLLQMLDPRTKIVSFIIFLLWVNSSRNIFFLLGCYALLLFLAYCSKISIRFFIFRVWLFLPFFAGLLALPLIFNIVTPGKVVFPILYISIWRTSLSITQNGLFAASFLLLRVALSVSLSIILVLTTNWTVLMKALEKLYVPSLFIAILLMTYRYIFVLLKITNNMFLARKSRMLGKMTNASNNAWISGIIGTLFIKTQDLGEDVYKAMKSRGYRNTVYILDTFSYKMKDYVAMISLICILFILSIITNKI